MNTDVCVNASLRLVLLIVLAAILIGPSSPSAGTDSGVPASVWSLKGNRGTDPDRDFLGTTDNHALILKTNSSPALTLGSDGPVEVHKSLLVHGDETVDKNLSVTGGLSAAGGFSLSGPLTLAGNAIIGGNLAVTGTATAAAVNVTGTTTTGVLTITGGSDLAEPFAVAGPSHFSVGSVLVIDDQHPGELKLSDRPYDRRVAGIVSGAEGIHSGIRLAPQGAHGNDVSLALCGRVYAIADASNGAIDPGDLLTTSMRPGHLMKATDPSRWPGAVVGKAMSGLDQGEGFVLVLVTLQ